MPLGVGVSRLRGALVLALVVLVLLANGFFFYNSHVRLSAATREVAETIDTRQLLSEMLNVVLSAETSHRGFMLTEEDSYLVPYHEALLQAEHLLARIGRLLRTDAAQMQRLVNLQVLVSERFQEQSSALTARRLQGAEAARRLILDNQQQGTLDEIRAVVQVMQADEDATLEARRLDWETAQDQAFAAFVIFLTVSAALVLALFSFMRRELVNRGTYNRKLQENAADLRRSLAEISTERNEIAQLATASTYLQGCQSLGELPEVLAPQLERLFPAHGGAVLARTAAGERLHVVAAWGSIAHPGELAASDCWALRQGQEHRHAIGGPAPLCPHLAQALGQLDTSTLCVPLTAHGETLGLLTLVASPDAVPDGAAAGEGGVVSADRLAAMLAKQLGLTLASLRIREVLKEQSIRDPLTGIFNRRYLDVVAPKEIAQVLRAGRTIAIAMADIDHFKGFNDRHGHQAGDAALVAVAGYLQESIRLGDWLFRYGGEEFLLLIQGIDPPALVEQLERLRQGVAGVTARIDHQVLPPVTISIGAAMCPGHGRDLESLVEVADRALYAAKQGGRDQVRLAPPMAAGEGAMPEGLLELGS